MTKTIANEQECSKLREAKQGYPQEAYRRGEGQERGATTECQKEALARENKRDYIRILRLAFPENNRAVARRFNRKHPGYKKRKYAEWYARNAEQRRGAAREIYWKNPEKFRAAKRTQRRINPDIERIATMKKKYGLSESDYRQLLEDQNYACAICGKLHVESSRKRLAVDHCHKTGKIRGLLCGTCNSGIAHLKEDAKILKAAIKYIKERCQ